MKYFWFCFYLPLLSFKIGLLSSPSEKFIHLIMYHLHLEKFRLRQFIIKFPWTTTWLELQQKIFDWKKHRNSATSVTYDKSNILLPTLPLCTRSCCISFDLMAFLHSFLSCADSLLNHKVFRLVIVEELS